MMLLDLFISKAMPLALGATQKVTLIIFLLDLINTHHIMSEQAFETLKREIKQVVIPHLATFSSWRGHVQVGDKETGKTVKIKSEHAFSVHRKNAIAVIPFQNVPSTFNKAFIDCKIQPGVVQIIKDLTLQIQITETGGSAAVTSVHAFFWITSEYPWQWRRSHPSVIVFRTDVIHVWKSTPTWRTESYRCPLQSHHCHILRWNLHCCKWN